MSLKVDIQKKFKGFTLDIRFENRGEGALGILGASGCGKSMTLKCISEAILQSTTSESSSMTRCFSIRKRG